MTIWNIEEKILNNVKLSPEEIRLVNEAINSHRLPEKLLACEALLRGQDVQQRTHGVRVLAEIVDDVNAEKEELDSNVVMAFFSLPWSVLKEPAFKLCINRAAHCANEGVRANNAVVLGRLAKRGEPWAISLLQEAKADASGIVRQNAEESLKLAIIT